jgi:ribosomal protein S27E
MFGTDARRRAGRLYGRCEMWNSKIDLPNEEGNVISLEVVRSSRYARALTKKCRHARVLIDTSLNNLECRDCGALLNPVEHLASLVEEWARIERLYENYRKEKDHVETRKKVKCRHCERFTPITR